MKIARLFALLGTTCIAFVAFLEYTVVNTALPTIQHVFNAPVLQLQWVMNIYFLIVSVSMMLMGRLADRYGRRLVFFIAVTVLAIASIAAGMSDSIAELVLSRAFQGISVGAIVTLAPALIYSVFGDDNHHAMSFYGMMSGIGLAAGPFIGGFIVVHWGWSWIFFINIPILLLGVLLSVKYLGESKSDEKLPIDYIGSLFLIIVLGGIIYGVIHAAQQGWSSTLSWLPIVVAIVFLPILLIHENKQSAPILNFHFFKKPLFVISALVCAVVGVISTVSLFFDPLFLSHIKLLSPKIAGLYLIMIPVAIVFFAPLLGKILKHLSAASVLIMSLVFALLAALLHLFFSIDLPMVVVMLAFFFIGMSWAICNIVPAMAVSAVVRPQDIGVAIGTVFSMFNIFSSIILAVSVVVFHLVSNWHHLDGSRQSFVSGFHAAFVLLSVILLLALLYACAIWRKAR